MKRKMLKKINNCLSNLEKCKKSLYRGKVYVVLDGETVSTCYKTKRGAQGFISRNNTGYFCEYSGRQVYSSYKIVELLEEELNTFDSYELWFNSLRQYISVPYLIENIVYYKKYVTNKELLSYIDRSILEIKNEACLTNPINEIALEKGFKNAQEYQEYINQKEDERWKRYEEEKAREKNVQERLMSINAISQESVKDYKIKKGKFMFNIDDINKAVTEDAELHNYIIGDIITVHNNDFDLISSNLLMPSNIYCTNNEMDSVMVCSLIKSQDGRNLIVNIDNYNYVEYSLLEDNVEIGVSPKDRFTLIINKVERKNKHLSVHDKLALLEQEYSALNAREKILNDNGVRSKKTQYKLSSRIDFVESEFVQIVRSMQESNQD